MWIDHDKWKQSLSMKMKIPYHRGGGDYYCAVTKHDALLLSLHFHYPLIFSK